MPSISVVIPTLNAQDELPRLLESLRSQSLWPVEVLIVDSSSEDDTLCVASRFEGVRSIVIPRSEFNHGLTRHLGVVHTGGDVVCFLTQDAVPASASYLESLVAPFCDQAVAMVSGRQLPKPDARLFERLVREFNYPAVSNTRSLADLKRLGVKTFFVSDACSAYRRSAYLKCGGFSSVRTNEDMLMAARFIHAGYKIAYAADAQVLHSHNLSPIEQYKRNYEVGYFLQEHASDLRCNSETGEGLVLVRSVGLQLLRKGNLLELVAFGVDCAARLLGNRFGRRAARRSLGQ